MTTEVRYVPLDEVCQVTKLAGFEYTNYFEYIEGGEVIALRGLNVKGGRLDLTDVKTISKDISDKLPRSQLRKNDILLTYTGTLGEVALIGENGKYHLAPNVCLVRPEKINPYFLYCCMRSDDFKGEVAKFSVGSTQQTIPMKNIRQICVPYPDSSAQGFAAYLMSKFDERIELNRKTNETLEAMAKALFKSWFVDFDPVRAKVEGRPTGLPAEISDLFPDSFEDSELGEIPSGWTVGKIRDLIEKTGMGPFGSRMKTETFQQSGVPIIKGGNLKGMLVEGCGPDYLSHEHAAELKSACVRAGDIVITHRGTLGQVSMVPLEGMVDEYIVSQSQFYLKPASIASGVFLLYFFHSPVGQSRLLANSSGVGVPSLSRPSTLTPEIDLILPPHPLLDLFAKQVVAKQRLFLSKQYEASTLCSVRDALLPKLISGEIRIPDAEKMLEEVGI